jgi:hypothetical protein
MEDKGSKGARTRQTTTKAPAGAASRPAATKPAATVKASAAKKPAGAGKTVTRPAAAAAGTAGPDRAELVRLAAYFRAERRGFAAGYEIEDWLAAEAEVAEKLGPAPGKAAGKPTARKA